MCTECLLNVRDVAAHQVTWTAEVEGAFDRLARRDDAAMTEVYNQLNERLHEGVRHTCQIKS